MTSLYVEISETPYCYDPRQASAIQEIATRVNNMRINGRLNEGSLELIRKYFKIKNIYHSNAIEGNTLNIGETRQVVEMGLTISGKPLKDQAEAKNLSEALDFLEKLASSFEIPITERDIRQIHYLVLKGISETDAGKYRVSKVEISGSAYIPPLPESVPPEMERFGKWLGQVSIPNDRFASSAGLLFAVVAHTWFVSIHPFTDGNGRTARLLMNLMLMRYGYPIAIISREDRLRYYDALETSQTSDLSGMIGLVSECIHESLEEYERAMAQQVVDTEWAKSIVTRLTDKERIRKNNEYEVWRSAMDLMKSYFRQTTEFLDSGMPSGRVFFKDFGQLEFEKYYNLSQGESVKRTWFFRVDFLLGGQTVRYLFFFGLASHWMRGQCDVTVYVAREERPYWYERLEILDPNSVPELIEIGYSLRDESFIARYKGHILRKETTEQICRQFIEDVTKKHFSL